MLSSPQLSGETGELRETRDIDLGVELDADATGWALCAGYLVVFFLMSHWAQLAVVLLSGGSVANLMVRRQISAKEMMKHLLFPQHDVLKATATQKALRAQAESKAKEEAAAAVWL